MDPPSPPVATLPAPLGEAPETPPLAGVRTTPILRYHLLWEAHQPGVTDKTYLSGKAIAMPPRGRRFRDEPAVAEIRPG